MEVRRRRKGEGEERKEISPTNSNSPSSIYGTFENEPPRSSTTSQTLTVSNNYWIYELFQNIITSTWNRVAEILSSWWYPSEVEQPLNENIKYILYDLIKTQRTNRKRLSSFRAKVLQPYNKEDTNHEAKLIKLWKVANPSILLENRVSKQWKILGFQGTDPATDFRGGGLFSLECMIHFGENHPKLFQKLIENGKTDSLKVYPFAITGLNIGNLIFESLGWGMKPHLVPEAVKRRLARFLFGDHSEEGETETIYLSRFQQVYCGVFYVLDSIWEEKSLSIMEFPVVLDSTRENFHWHIQNSQSLQELVNKLRSI
jgi:hypothetical protein